MINRINGLHKAETANTKQNSTKAESTAANMPEQKTNLLATFNIQVFRMKTMWQSVRKDALPHPFVLKAYRHQEVEKS